uniref:Uncharacterized protein n=1 Tax=Strongyloides papillosus TaxID=174720 RepID=A0A0N5B7J2_STREA
MKPFIAFTFLFLNLFLLIECDVESKIISESLPFSHDGDVKALHGNNKGFEQNSTGNYDSKIGLVGGYKEPYMDYDHKDPQRFKRLLKEEATPVAQQRASEESGPVILQQSKEQSFDQRNLHVRQISRGRGFGRPQGPGPVRPPPQRPVRPPPHRPVRPPPQRPRPGRPTQQRPFRPRPRRQGPGPVISQQPLPQEPGPVIPQQLRPNGPEPVMPPPAQDPPLRSRQRGPLLGNSFLPPPPQHQPFPNNGPFFQGQSFGSTQGQEGENLLLRKSRQIDYNSLYELPTPGKNLYPDSQKAVYEDENILRFFDSQNQKDYNPFTPNQAYNKDLVIPVELNLPEKQAYDYFELYGNSAVTARGFCTTYRYSIYSSKFLQSYCNYIDNNVSENDF